MKRTAKEALALFLQRLMLRSSLSSEERRAILDLDGRVAAVTGDFVQVGDHPSEACLIVDGLVARYAQTRSGERGIVGLHIPGDMADLHSLVAPNVTWALHALTATTVLRVAHADLRALLDRLPGLATAFWRDCVVDGNVLAQWTVNIARKESFPRVAHMLCEMSARYGAIGLGTPGRFPFPIKQLDLADAVGLTPVHLNRIIKRLREEGLAEKDLAGVRILDRTKLTAVAEFDPAYLQLDGAAAAQWSASR